MTLVEQTFIPDLSERPPDRLNIVVMVGDVRVLHIRPEADAVAHDLPVALVGEDAVLTLLDEILDAVLLDLRLAAYAERLFDLQLDRKSVRVPAGLAQYLIALHGAVSGDQILYRAGQNVTDMRLAVSRRRTVEERIYLGALAVFYTLFK